MDIRRKLFRPAQDFLHNSRRQLRRLLTSPRTAKVYARYSGQLRRHDWAGMRESLRPFCEQALRAKDVRLLGELGQAALRLDEYQLGMDMIYAAHRLGGNSKASDWQGEDISDATLVISLAEKATPSVVAGVNTLGYVRAAAQRAAQTIIIVDPRMVALFSRTLPEITVLPIDADPAPHMQGRVVTAGMVDLQYILGFDPDTIAKLRVPLIPDAETSRQLRQDYLAGRDVPLVGISWWSSHTGKDLPASAQWHTLLEAIPAQFVSLQYGDISGEIEQLTGNDRSRLIVDESVDQLKDMDRFASQIAALDLVISISNSGAHLTGALGQRMILVRDDLFRRSWPYLSRSVPWQADTIVIGKDERPWDEAFREIIETAKATLSERR
jgi:hypothetical protein